MDKPSEGQLRKWRKAAEVEMERIRRHVAQTHFVQLFKRLGVKPEHLTWHTKV